MAGGWLVNVCVFKYSDVFGRDTAHSYMAQLRKKKRLQGQHAWRSAVHVDLRDWRGLACRREEGRELCFVLCGTVVDDDWMCECGGEAV